MPFQRPTHCKRGHCFAEFAFTRPNGTHYCGLCAREKQRELKGCKERVKQTPEERFWAATEKSDGCWLWQKSLTTAGYGKFQVENKTVLAPRFSYELANGPIADGLFVCHNCPSGDNPRCVNPAHLFLGTHKDNVADMVAKGRHRNQLKTHCPHGHEYNEANTCILKKTGNRICRVCARLRQRAKRV